MIFLIFGDLFYLKKSQSSESVYKVKIKTARVLDFRALVKRGMISCPDKSAIELCDIKSGSIGVIKPEFSATNGTGL
ncbi:hypothetical protein [Okeania sp. SIO1F9]|uniref:hypothetical protein n=1 Tax=Okeania sp. SIO1F9 TaxID=2607813 RepID=UPI00144DA36D|nr:hypothetical protein [Okeania sp. SIO1F9]NET78410.1 hypothetical protein [Okeania sp. SIO1F9]